MSANDTDETSVPANPIDQLGNASSTILHGDMSAAGAATRDRSERAQTTPDRMEPDADAGNALKAPDDDALGTLTTGGTGGTTGVSGTAEGTFEGAGRRYGDPDTVRDDRHRK